MKYRNIYSLFSEKVLRHAGENVFYVRRSGEWGGIPWDRFNEEVHQFAAALIAMDLAPGKSVCILMGNIPEWPIADIGTIAAGGVAVGLYPTASAEQCAYVINHSDAEFVLVDAKSQLEKILSVRHELRSVKAIIALDEAAALRNEGMISYKGFLRMGKENRDRVQETLLLRAENANPEDIAIMVYTSGTTGQPKGACLSHRYVINSVESLQQVIPITDKDVSFSYLPYCHVAERISGLYNRLYGGASAYFVDDLSKLWDYMLEVRPTIFASLPRFFEKMHARITSDLDKTSETDRLRFEKTLELGRKISRLRQAGMIAPEVLIKEYEIISAPVLNVVRSYFGGRVRAATSGGAPLPFEIAEFFDALGIPILQAYGLTENVCTAFNRPDDYRFGTVGPPMPGCEVKIASDGEILLRSDMMFSGYYKEPEKTAEIFSDGWLLTGDIGEMTSDGFLKITGRKKELIVTSTGKNIAPALIENLLKERHLISHAMAYGDGKSYLTALITLNQFEAEEYARTRGIPFKDFSDLIQSEDMKILVEEIVQSVNSRVSSTEAIKKYVVLDRDLSIEEDEVTPTMKIKRSIVAKRYEHLLERLYE